MGIMAVWNEYYTAKNYIQDALRVADKQTVDNLKEALKCLETFERYVPK
jgi:hypothetical protein